MMRWQILRLLVMLVLHQVLAPAHAQQVFADSAVLEDPGGKLTLDQVRQGDFTPARRLISLGYTRSALWVRLRVHAPGDARLALRVFPAQLEDVRVYAPRLPAQGQPVAGAGIVDIGSGAGDIYLRVRTSGPMFLLPSIASEAEAHAEGFRRGMVSGALMACYIALAVWLIALVVRRGQLLDMALLLNLSVVLASYLGWMGYLAEFFGPEHWAGGSAALHFLGVSNVFTGFLCVYMVLERFGMPRWGRRAFGVLAVLYSSLFVLFFVLDRQLVLEASAALGLVASVLGLPLTLAVFYRRKGSAWFIGAVLLCALALGLRWLLTVFALMPTADSLPNLLIFRIVFSMGFVSAIAWLIDREKVAELQAARMSEAMARQLAGAETQRRETQERFMTMLMHELKNPLAIIQLATASLGRHLQPGDSDARRVRNIHRAVDDLNALVERCAAADQVDQGAMPMQKQALRLGELAAELARSMGEDRIALHATADDLVYSDAQYLRLILLNLLSNALKYSPAGSQVELRLMTATPAGVPGVAVSVMNRTGAAGQPDPAQVFTRYYRAEGARKQVGAGLGLWLCHTLARQLGADLRYDRIAQGVCFSFFLEAA